MKNHLPIMKSFFASTVCVLFFVGNGIGQRNVNTARGEIKLDSIELCFGYKIKRCVFDQDLYGLQPRNYTRLKLKTSMEGHLEDVEFLYNSNNSLNIEDFQTCVFPYIELSNKKYKRRYEVHETKELAIIFEDEINGKSEYSSYLNLLNDIKSRSITYYIEQRKSKSVDWDENINKFNRNVVKEDAESIFLDLEESLSEMVKKYDHGYRKCESRKEKIAFSNKTQSEFDGRIYSEFKRLLKNYFENK